MKNVELMSGKILRFDYAPFSEAQDLYQLVTRELKDSVSISNPKELEIGTIAKDIVLGLLSSKDISEKAMECAVKCVYEQDKVNKELFSSVDAREDYLEIMAYVIIENIKPFTKNLTQKYEVLFSRLTELVKKDLV